MANPSDQDVFQPTERRHQDWRCGEFRDMAREWRRRFWRIWALLIGYVDESVGLGDLS